MRTVYGSHRTGVDDDVLVTMAARHVSFEVHYFRGKVHVDLGSSCGMQLTVEQAVALRQLLDAGIADALAAATVLELPAGGDPA
ncbi:hypothetical protein AWN90_32105 [Nocardia terpenica]|uniref:Uncharacterized protein n=1 Tax=Nocardia terpenica TaxID=455432 RepID=A0A164MF95_9NOCA|nr:hypothetical protein AWN90_32105 [Nocardia terpenica]